MRSIFFVIMGYAVVVGLVFGRALLPGDGYLLFGDDIHRQYYFYRQFFNSFLKEGIWPWWNPYTFSGTPFIANPIVNIWYPPTWLFFFLPLNIAYSWHVAIHLVWAMLGMYVLIRRMSQISQIGQIWKTVNIGPWVAGLIFGLSGFFTARIWAGHVDVIAAASWMPWVLAAFIKAIKATPGGWSRFTPVLFAGAIFALQLLAGYQTMAFMTAIAVGFVVSFHSYFEKSWRPMLLAGLAGLLGIGLAAIQVIPLQEFFQQGIRTFEFPYSWNSYGSLTWESLKQFVTPFPFGDQTSYQGPASNYAEQAFFVGRVGLLVAIVFLFLRLPRVLRSPRLLMFLFLALFGLWVSLGPNAPIDLQYLLWKFVPMYKYLRIPPRHLILVVFGMSGLIGLAMCAIRSTRLRLMLAGLITIEMIFFARHFIALKPIPEMRHDAELINILSPPRCRSYSTPEVACLYRVLPNFGVWVEPRDSFDFDAGMQYRIFSATGYDPSILRSYYEYIDIANGVIAGSSILDHDVQVPYLNVFSQATDFLNIKYILVPRGYDPLYGVKTDRFVLRREDVSRDYRLYENKTVKPRFFFENNEEGRVEVERYLPNEIVLSTDNNVAAILMSSEVFYPGWEGFIDGKRVDVVKVNHAFRALFVPAGQHTVVLRYSSKIFVYGGLVSLVSLMICLLITITFRLKPIFSRAS